MTMHPIWAEWLAPVLDSDDYGQLQYFIADREKRGATVYPPEEKRLRVFERDPNQIRVVIVGQDPYHGPGQAVGLSFSVGRGVARQPSLKNICKELEADIPGTVKGSSGDLSNWEREGVFLLNTILTVEKGSPASHQNMGWEVFTDAALKTLAEQRKGLVFILWGKHAQAKKALIPNTQGHYILESPHPSPFSADRGFFGSRPFSKTNAFLVRQHQRGIDWTVGGLQPAGG